MAQLHDKGTMNITPSKRVKLEVIIIEDDMTKQIVKGVIECLLVAVLVYSVGLIIYALLTMRTLANSSTETPVPSRYYSTASDFAPCCGTSSSNCAIKD